MTETSAAHALYTHAAIIRRLQLSLNSTTHEILSGDLKAQNRETIRLLGEVSSHIDQALNCCARGHLLELLSGGVE